MTAAPRASPARNPPVAALVQGVQLLARAMRDLPRLHTLCLDLRVNNMGGSGMYALGVALRNTALQTVRLNLPGNQVGDAGAEGLAEGLADAPSLTSLNLCLDANQVGTAGAKALAAVLEISTTLQQVSLSLMDNHVGQGGMQALQAVRCEGWSFVFNPVHPSHLSYGMLNPLPNPPERKSPKCCVIS